MEMNKLSPVLPLVSSYYHMILALGETLYLACCVSFKRNKLSPRFIELTVQTVAALIQCFVQNKLSHSGSINKSKLYTEVPDLQDAQ